jgi:maltase-glucoamylase
LDNEAYGVDKQFLVGPAFLVTPVIDQGKTSVKGYFPADFWYSFYDGKKEDVNENSGKWLDLDAPIDFIPLHVRGGHIIPTQDPARTTEASRKNPFGLVVAPNEQNEAKGDLFYDDGQAQLSKKTYYFATFILKDNVLKMNVEFNNYAEMSQKKLNKIRIFVNVNEDIKKHMKFYVNDQRLTDSSKVSFENNQIILNDLNLPMTDNFKLEWSFNDFTETKTVIDCSLRNEPLSENDCLAKKCEYNQDSFFSTTKCFIPETVGGYKIKSDSNPKYTLTRNTDFNLLGEKAKDIQELTVAVSHKLVGDGKSKMTNIKVYNH